MFVFISVYYASCNNLKLPGVETVRPLQGDINWLMTIKQEEVDDDKKIELITHHQSLQRAPVPNPRTPSCCTNFPRNSGCSRCPPNNAMTTMNFA
ncbi:hypothetical protein MKW92_043579, partial [Papaver armeniacum]